MITIVGMSNPRGDPERALEPWPAGSAGHRLWAMVSAASGIGQEDWLLRTRRRNLCRGPWDAEEARRTAWRLLGDQEEGPLVILGREAWAAFGLPRAPWMACRDGTFWLLPHPSGRSLVLNDPLLKKSVGDLLALLLAQEHDRQ